MRIKEVGRAVLGACVLAFVLLSIIGWTSLAVAAGFVAIIAAPVWAAGAIRERRRHA
jgi:hypothetical protein